MQIIEQGSGPGASLYACAPCREQRGLDPFAEQADVTAYRRYLDHTDVCPDCGAAGRCEGGARLWEAYRATLRVPAP